MIAPESGPEDADAARAWMSALADGRDEACDPAMAAWTRDAQARSTWHAYHLIGDVLRSDDLAVPAQHDEAFLQRLRERLILEPTVLAPQSMVSRQFSSAGGLASRRPSIRWGAAAAFAGVALVGGVVFSLQRAQGEAQVAGAIGQSARAVSVGAQSPARSTSAGTQLTALSSASGAPAPVSDLDSQQWHMLDERVVREARLESYLRAHRGRTPVGGRVEPVALGR